MILSVLVAMIVVAASLAAALDAALGALRQGREDFLRVVVEASAGAAIASGEAGAWIPLTGSVPAGGALTLAPIVDGRGVATVTEARRIGGSLWVLRTRAELVDNSGSRRAAYQATLIVRIVQNPADSTLRAVPVRRAWHRRPT